MNQSIRLARRPEGLASPEDFNITEEPLAPLQEGQLRVRNRFISLDPAMRGWMSDVPSYVPPVGLGEVMRAYTAGVVESSRHPDFQEGDAVTGILGVQTHAVSDGRGLLKVDTQQAPLERWIGGLGMPGMTAYFGLLEIGKPKAGESAAMKKKRASFKARHAKNIAKGKMSAAYWANKSKW